MNEIERVLNNCGAEILCMADDDFETNFQIALNRVGGCTDYRTDRERPYDGQPHTDFGERGKQLVEGLTMRDISDCICKGWFVAAGQQDNVDAELWRYNELYKIEGDLDPMAVIQNATCEIEKMMGIFPNIPKTIKL